MWQPATHGGPSLWTASLSISGCGILTGVFPASTSPWMSSGTSESFLGCVWWLQQVLQHRPSMQMASSSTPEGGWLLAEFYWHIISVSLSVIPLQHRLAPGGWGLFRIYFFPGCSVSTPEVGVAPHIGQCIFYRVLSFPLEGNPLAYLIIILKFPCSH